MWLSFLIVRGSDRLSQGQVLCPDKDDRYKGLYTFWTQVQHYSSATALEQTKLRHVISLFFIYSLLCHSVHQSDIGHVKLSLHSLHYLKNIPSQYT